MSPHNATDFHVFERRATSTKAKARQEFLFIDSTDPEPGKRKGRRSVRSFVMQQARRQNPWSTSKSSTKNSPTVSQKHSASSSPQAPDTWSLPDPSAAQSTRFAEQINEVPAWSPSGLALSSPAHYVMKCITCAASQCMPGGNLCSNCLVPDGPSSVTVQPYTFAQGSIDPFSSLPCTMTPTCSKLLNHCKYSTSHMLVHHVGDGV